VRDLRHSQRNESVRPERHGLQQFRRPDPPCGRHGL
jgi:hypothetical protein